MHPAPPAVAAPQTLAGWSALFDSAGLPVLATTAAAIGRLHAQETATEDSVDALHIADVVTPDPLMTLKVLAHVARLRRGRGNGEPEIVTSALVMLGITPFFRAFAEQPTVEQLLQHQSDASAGFDRVLQRSRRAARLAMGFAVHRMDHDAAVIHEAALLHDFAELLLWLRVPALAAQIEQRQAADAGLRSAVVQRELLGVELADLEQALMRQWGLPALLVQITDGRATRPTPQIRNVQLAIRLARHSARGWDNAALPDDIDELAVLLNLAPAAALRLVREIDRDDGEAAASET